MICCSIKNKSFEDITELLRKVEMAEIRLDLCCLEDSQIEEIFSSDVPLAATYRVTSGDYSACEKALSLAITSGAHYVDLQLDAPVGVARRIQRACSTYGSVLIRSWHDYEGTPDLDTLRQMADKCRNMGGEVVKIVTTAHCTEDVERVLSLYKYYSPQSLIAFAMGERGRSSRIACLGLGAPFSYACPEMENATAEGQISYDEMYGIVYGGGKSFSSPRSVQLPSSKSYAQRAILSAALACAGGTSVLKGYTPCADSEAALRLVEALGASCIRKDGQDGRQTLEIASGGDVQAYLKQHPDTELNVGESGLLARLMLPLGAHLAGAGAVRIKGAGTLEGRCLQGAKSAMEALGTRVECEAPEGDIVLPSRVAGPLRGGRAVIDGSHSSQLLSGALMALPLAARGSTLVIRHPTSVPYIYMTMEILRRFGIKTRSRMLGGGQMLDEDWSNLDEIEIRIKENQTYRPCEIMLEADWSAAAVFLIAGAVFGRVEIDGLDTSSLQADITMMDILVDAGASVSQVDEPTGMITVRKAPLRPVEADLSNSPDLFPAVAVLCAFCQGTSRLAGVHRLHHKESDRAQEILRTLKALGVAASIKGDILSISGESLCSRLVSGHLLHGGSFTSAGDHRMVMALSLASLGADSPVEIDDVSCVGKSFPDFAKTFAECCNKMNNNEHVWE